MVCLKAVFHNVYLFHFVILCFMCSSIATFDITVNDYFTRNSLQKLQVTLLRKHDGLASVTTMLFKSKAFGRLFEWIRSLLENLGKSTSPNKIETEHFRNNAYVFCKNDNRKSTEEEDVFEEVSDY